MATLLGGGQLLTASAAGSATASSFVPITPCRLFDTRTGGDNIGPRATPLGPDETYFTPVWGANGNCTIPAGATGVSLGVTMVNPTAASYLTVFPADATRPLSSNLNWVAGQAPTPNAVTAALSADGRLGLYNLAGTVDLLVDIVGYYELASTGPAGPPGPPGVKGDTGLTGEKGDTGDPGPRPAQVVWVAKSGGDFTTLSAALASITDSSSTKPYLIRIAPGLYTEADTVLLKDYVDIEGSGQDITTVTCACAGEGLGNASATIATAGQLHAQTRDVAIVNTGGGDSSYAVGTFEASSTVSFEHVTATASGGSDENIGFFNRGVPTAPTLTDVTIIATGGLTAMGIDNLSSSTSTLTQVTVTASAATVNNWGILFEAGGTARILDSYISGSTSSVRLHAVGTVRIADTVLAGATQGVGAGNCVDVVNAALAPITCT